MSVQEPGHSFSGLHVSLQGQEQRGLTCYLLLRQGCIIRQASGVRRQNRLTALRRAALPVRPSSKAASSGGWGWPAAPPSKQRVAGSNPAWDAISVAKLGVFRPSCCLSFYRKLKRRAALQDFPRNPVDDLTCHCPASALPGCSIPVWRDHPHDGKAVQVLSV